MHYYFSLHSSWVFGYFFQIIFGVNITLFNFFQAIDDAFKISLPKPSFTSYKTMDYVEHMYVFFYRIY